MVIYNAATRELTAKIVYYGAGLCGKTTNLKVLHDRLEPGTAGKLLNLQTQSDRTIYFDLLPVELGDIKGYKIRFQLATVPGQAAFNETRRVVLKGVDGIVFVADSQWTMLPKNLEAWQNLKDNLKVNAINFESIPVVVQYNKRDLGDILAVDAMQEALGLSQYPFVEAVASAGRGVTETFKLISKLTFVDLLRRLQGRRAEEAGEAAAAEAERVRQDDLQSWKDSLLKRESAPGVPVQRPSRPLSLVPPVSDEAPFDTTELGRGVDDEEAVSPFAVQAPSDMAAGTSAPPENPAATVQMPAVGDAMSAPPAPEEGPGIEIEIPNDLPDEADEYAAAEAAGENLEEAVEASDSGDAAEPAEDAPEELVEEVAQSSALGEPVTDPAFLPAEVARDERVELLEVRLRESEDRAARGREASERMHDAIVAVQDRVAETASGLSALMERLSAIESGVGGLQEALGAALARLSSVESSGSRQGEIETGLRGLESGLRELDERLRSETHRQRKDSDDAGMALRELTERAQGVERELSALGGRIASQDERLAETDGRLGGLQSLDERVPRLEGDLAALRGISEKLPELEMRVESILRQHHELVATFEEKTQQGRREAEDIRSQIAPLLEDRVRRHESDAMLFAEMERLRESLSESLHDLAERVRHTVKP